MVAPWYSGMAQGQALSAFIRLYNVTNDDSYLKISSKSGRVDETVSHYIRDMFKRINVNRGTRWQELVAMDLRRYVKRLDVEARG